MDLDELWREQPKEVQMIYHLPADLSCATRAEMVENAREVRPGYCCVALGKLMAISIMRRYGSGLVQLKRVRLIGLQVFKRIY